MSKEPVYIDPETGLPAVPEGYFWRISETSSADWWRIELRKRRRWGSRRIAADHRLYPAWDFDTPELFEDGARRRAAVLWVDHFAAKDAQKYLGDYPPKALRTPLLEDKEDTDADD